MVSRPVTEAHRIRSHGAPSSVIEPRRLVRFAMTSAPESAEVT